MKNLSSLIGRIASKLNLANLIAFSALLVSLPGLWFTVNQIGDLKSNAEESRKRLEQAEQQIAATRQQAAETRRVADAANASAEAAKEQAQELRRSNALTIRNSMALRYSNYARSRPRIEFEKIVSASLLPDGQASYIAKFASRGETPAINVRTWVTSGAFANHSTLGTTPDCHAPEMFGRSSFQTGLIVIEKLQIDRGSLKGIASGTHSYVIRGRVCYEDEEGGLHLTDFCMSLRGTNAKWVYASCHGGNVVQTLRTPPFMEEAVSDKRPPMTGSEEPPRQ